MFTLFTPPPLTPTAILDILAVAYFIYQFIQIMRGRRAAHVLSGIGILLLLYVAALLAGLELMRSILATLAPYSVFALIVMFQSEIRRVLARLGRGRWFALGSRLQRREIIEEIMLAVRQLAAEKTGALIVLEGDIGLRTFVESGVYLDAAVSNDLLLAIFQPNGAMHDGAAIIQGDRVAAAACFLPLTMNPMLFRQLGTRHRAGIGVTEETDCLAVIVSEETGRISIAAHGEIEMHISPEKLVERLNAHFGGKREPARPMEASPARQPSPSARKP